MTASCRVCGWTTKDPQPFAQFQAAQHLDTMSDDPAHRKALRIAGRLRATLAKAVAA